MSDALHTILADPELQAWPHRSTTTIPVEDPAENTEQPFVTPRQDNADVPTPDTPAPSTEIAAAPVTGLTAAPDRAAPAPLNPLLITAAHPAAADRTAVGAADRDDTYLPPHANSASDADEPDEDATSGGAPNSPTAPLAFDEIARRRNPLGDKFGDAAEWLKSNWRRPKVLGAAAAAVVAAVTLTAWASAAGEQPPPPTATLTAPSSAAPPGPAAAAPADGPIPVTAASARCPAPSSDPMNALRPDSTQPWICVRAWGIDGQVLTLTLDGPYVISAVRIMPGVNTESDGQDQWLKYRTVARAAWTFNDSAHTKITQATDSRRELLTQTVAPSNCSASPCRVVASQVVLTVEKTTAPASAPTGTGLNPVGDAATEDSSAFGVSRIEIIGHRAG
ncbi:MAG: hypothetical protein U0R66_17575 [Mycobacterium sp.]